MAIILKALARYFEDSKNINYMFCSYRFFYFMSEIFGLPGAESQFKLTLAKETESTESYY